MKYSALTWVKITIDESLKQTRQALEQFVENSTDTAPLQQCVVWLHEIRGALSVLELQTASLLVQEIELTLKGLLAGKIENDTKTYDSLMRSLIQLPNYLDHLAIVQQDIPLALLPTLNNLRALRKQPALAASSLFTPDLSLPIPPPAKAVKLPDDKLKPHVLKLRAAYQKGLMALMKAPTNPAGPKAIYTVMQHLQQITGVSPVTKIWWVCEGVLESLLQKGLDANNTLLNLFKQMDAVIKQIVEQGNLALRQPPPKALLTNLLYFAATARSKGKIVTTVKQTFRLNDYFPSESALQGMRDMFSGPDIELMKTVVTLLKDEFARVEETLDIFNRAENPSASELAPLVNMLRDMANTLGLLGLDAQRQSLLKLSGIIHEVAEGRKSSEFKVLLQIANDLLQTSNALEILGVQGIHARSRLRQMPNTEFFETPQFGLVLSVVVTEAKNELAQVIQPLVSFIENPKQDEALLQVPLRLKQVQGFLAISAHERAAKLLARCNQYIQQVFIKENMIPTEEKLKALADTLVSIELYLDTLAGNPMDGKDILDITEKRLKVLIS